MAFSLKSLLKRKGKGAAADESDDDIPFMPGYEEITESEARSRAGGGNRGKKGKKGKGLSVPALLAKLPLIGSKVAAAKAANDPLDNPALLALIASELEALPPPEVPVEDLLVPPPEPEDPLGLPGREEPVLDAGEIGSADPDLGMLEEDDFLAGGPLGPDAADDAYRRLQRRRAMAGTVATVAALAVLGGLGWWIMLPPEPEEWTSEGLTVLNEKGEQIVIPPAEAVVSGWRITMAMPPPPKAPLQQKAEAKPGDPAGALGTEKSTSRRPWLNQGGDAAAGSASGDGAAKPGETPQTPPAGAEPAPEQTAGASKMRDPLSALPPLSEPLRPVTRASGTKPPSYAALPALKVPPQPLKEAPDPDLAKRSPLGILPIIGKDGRASWQAYAHPFKMPETQPANTPRVSVIVAGLGLHPEATETAITKLPPEVTLAFSPYSPRLEEMVKKARAHGHEVLIELPLEPENFPSQDPGPLGLLTILPQTDNVTRLETILGRSVGYIGLLGRMGGKYGASKVHMRTVLETLSRYGVMYVHTASPKGLEDLRGIAVPVVQTILPVDEKPFREAVDARLDYLATVARQRGTAVGVLTPSPLGYDRLLAWMAAAQGKGVAFTPVSAATGQPSG